MSLYDDVADTLPRDIVEAIEVALPCAGGFDHLWDVAPEISMNPSGHILVHSIIWRCVHCVVASHTDPRPASARAIPLVSANLEEFL